MGEIAVILDGEANRLRRDRNNLAWLAWHTAAMTRMKKMPKLRDVMVEDGARKRRAQTIDEQIAIAKMWTAAVSRKRR